LEEDDALEMIAKAKEFVEEVKKWLAEHNLL